MPLSLDKIHFFDYKCPETIGSTERFCKVYKKNVPLFLQKVVSISTQTFAAVASLTVVGAFLWIPINRFKDLSHKIDLDNAQEAFLEKMKDVPVPKELQGLSLIFKAYKYTKNLINEYAIGSDNNLWYRKIGTPAWKPLFFDGSLSGRIPVKISADGANLTVIDDQGGVHYRKVSIEGRGPKTEELRFLRHTDIIEEKNENDYVVIDKTEKQNWKPGWYSFPIVHRIVNFFTGKRLIANADFLISHRGRYNDYFEDAAGYHHPTGAGVTTGYQFDEDNTSIRKFDPWAPKNSMVRIFFPESENKKFVGMTKDVSASSLMILGYEYDLINKTKSLRLLTNLCDIDTMGSNPSISYRYLTENDPALKDKYEKEDIRFLPDRIENEGWEEHAFPEGAIIYNKISIFQNGQGNRAKELFLGAEYKDKKGYFTKTLQPGSAWVFQEDSAALKGAQPLENSEENVVVPEFLYKKSVSDYQGEGIRLNNFGPHAYGSKIKLFFEGNEYTLGLHRRLGLAKFVFGVTEGFYSLVIPEDIKDGVLVKAFGGRKVIPVHIKEYEEHGKKMLQINPKGTHPKLPVMERT